MTKSHKYFLLISASILVLLGCLWYNHSVNKSEPPLLKADLLPKRIKPEAIESEIVSNNDSIYDTLKNQSESIKTVNLVPEPETPINLNPQKSKQEDDAIDNIISNIVDEANKQEPEILTSESQDNEAPAKATIHNDILTSENPPEDSSTINEQKPEIKSLNIVTIPSDAANDTKEKVIPKSYKTDYYIQIASTRTKAQADKEWNRISKSQSKILSGLGHKIVKHEMVGSGVFYQLLTGPIKNSSNAKLVCKKLVNAKQNCIIKRM